MSYSAETQESMERRLTSIERLLAEVASQLNKQAEFQALMAQRISDLRYMSIDEVAAAWKCSAKTVRRRIADHKITLMQIPGTKIKGIPIMQVWPDRVDVRVLATAQERDRA